MLTKLLVTSLWQNLFCAAKVFVFATASLGLRRSWVRGAESSSLAAEEKLLERLRWIEVSECDIAEYRRVEGLALHLNCREQSLAEADRAARMKVRGVDNFERKRKEGCQCFNWTTMR